MRKLLTPAECAAAISMRRSRLSIGEISAKLGRSCEACELAIFFDRTTVRAVHRHHRRTASRRVAPALASAILAQEEDSTRPIDAIGVSEDAFSRAMRKAISTGLERAPVGVATTPGTRAPRTLPGAGSDRVIGSPALQCMDLS